VDYTEKSSKNKILKINKGKPLPPSYEPGMIEVLFKEKAKIRLAKIPKESKKRWSLTAQKGVDLKPLEHLLDEVECSMIARTFTSSTEDEYDRLHRKAKEKQPTVQNLNNFFTIHFPPDKDPTEVAKAFKKLPMVEHAYAVPTAVPPSHTRLDLCRFAKIIGPCTFIRVIARPCTRSTPLNEPLVGNRDTVYVADATRNLENQWYVFRCDADSAWTLACGAGVVVADVDWGFRTTHEELSSRFDLNHAYNSYDGSSNVSVGGDIFHGTGVTGLAGAADNKLGMIGFAFGCTLWPVQANTGTGAPLGGNSWAGGIDWVRSQSTSARKVIILEVQAGSFGNYEMTPSVNAAIVTAIADGVVVCVAAGNGDRDAGVDDSGNPIPFTGSIVVGATEYDPSTNPRAWFSNWGARVDVAAPGDSSHDLTCSSSADDEYTNFFGGTSGATPKVAGTVAMMLQCNPNLTPEEVRNIIRSTASQTVVTDPNKPVGGFLNAYEAVKEACRKAEPCQLSLVVDWCRTIRVVDACPLTRITDTCLKTNILVDPCRLKRIIEPCMHDRIVIGPCCTRELIAGDPFWRRDEFESWNKAYKELQTEAMKHFKRLTAKS